MPCIRYTVYAVAIITIWLLHCGCAAEKHHFEKGCHLQFGKITVIFPPSAAHITDDPQVFSMWI